MTKTIKIFDTTLRDGEQSPGVSLSINEKIEIGRQLTKLGVDIIEAGFPISSLGDFEGVEALAKGLKGVTVAALARANHKDIDRAWEALSKAESPRIHTFIATSDIHLKHKLRKSEEEVLELAVKAVQYAKKYAGDVEFSAEDATRSNPEFLCRVVEAVIRAGATVVNLPDTVGYCLPQEYGRFIAHVKNTVPNIDQAIISVHCHNDLGLAVANSLAAVENGAGQIECTINGIGERAGNAALEELVMAIKTRKDFLPYQLGINTEQIYRTSRLVSSLSGMAIQSNKAIVGANAFAHESGIHQDGVLKERTTYEIMDPKSIGLNENKIVLGKHSGRHAFKERLKDLGYDLPEEEIDKMFTRFKDLADRKGEVSDKDVQALIEAEISSVAETYCLDYLHISSGNKMIPTATVRIKTADGIIQDASCGDGPVDAVYQAINRLTELEDLKLIDYVIEAVTGGQDALGEVMVKVERKGKVFTGRGISTDIIEASARAYISAINRSLAIK